VQQDQGTLLEAEEPAFFRNAANDERAIRRRELQTLFGVGFGEAGQREVDVL
jgi:hypothetical protein